MGEDNHRKGTEPVVLTKIQVVNSITSRLNSNDLSGYALSLAKMVARLVYGKARSEDSRGANKKNH